MKLTANKSGQNLLFNSTVESVSGHDQKGRNNVSGIGRIVLEVRLFSWGLYYAQLRKLAKRPSSNGGDSLGSTPRLGTNLFLANKLA